MKKSLVLLLSIFMSISLISFNIVKTSAEDEVNEPEVIENVETIGEQTEETEEEHIEPEIIEENTEENNENFVTFNNQEDDNATVLISDLTELKAFLVSNDTKTGKLTGSSFVLSNSTSDVLTVNGNKTLDLNGKTIEADEDYSSFMFDVGGSLVINDSTTSKTNPYGLGIINGNYSDQITHNNFIGGFYIRSGASLIINSGTIKNMYINQAGAGSNTGAAIYNLGLLVINGGLITDCAAVYGGAIYNGSQYQNASTTINGGEIYNCTAIYYGGAVYNYGYDLNNTYIASLTINNGIIHNCNAGVDGGAIYNNAYRSPAKVLIKGGTIDTCFTTTDDAGAIYNCGGGNNFNAAITIESGLISNCTAKDDGGAIYTSSENGNNTITIKGGTIQNCKATDGNGGAIYNLGNNESYVSEVIIEGGIIGSCESESRGSAIYNNAYLGPAKLTIKGGTIENCVGDDTFGTIYNKAEAGNANILITNGKIINCSAYCGGAISNICAGKLYEANLTIEGGEINNCTSDFGGAIYNCSTSGPAKITINDGLITNCSSGDGGAIYNYGYNDSAFIIINNGKIINCSAYYGGAISNYTEYNNTKASLTINNGLISSCKSTGYGGAIYNCSDDAGQVDIVINNGKIQNCESYYGGAIYNYSNYVDGYSVFNLTINNGTIDHCKATSNGGAICADSARSYGYVTINDGLISNCSGGDGGAYYGYGYSTSYPTVLTINGGSIKNCTSNYSAIDLYANVLLEINGIVNFDCKNSINKEDDICVDTSSKVVLKEGFNTNNKIGVWVRPGSLGHDVKFTNFVKSAGYSLNVGETLNDKFVAANGQEYLIETGTTLTDHNLSIKSVQIVTQPTLDSNYKLSTDIDGTQISTKYQWYKANILDKVIISNVGHYGEYDSDKLDFTVSKDSLCSGVYDSETGVWTEPELSKSSYNYYLFKIEGLKEGETISFDYSADPTSTFIYFSLYDGSSYLCVYSSSDTSNVNGSYKATIPHDGTYWLCVYNYNNQKYTKTDIKNIVVKHLDTKVKMSGEIFDRLTHPAANADISCRVAYTNADGYTDYEFSNPLNFGDVIDGYDKQVIKPGTSKDLIIKFDTDPNKVTYYKPSEINKVKVYVDGLDNELTRGQEYDIDLSEIQSNANPVITLTLNKDYVSTLSEGDHAYFVKVSDTKGYECIATNVIVKKDSPAPSPGKDESCEKVIGPTWHWNNDKDVCEEVYVVGTSTR